MIFMSLLGVSGPLKVCKNFLESCHGKQKWEWCMQGWCSSFLCCYLWLGLWVKGSSLSSLSWLIRSVRGAELVCGLRGTAGTSGILGIWTPGFGSSSERELVLLGTAPFPTWHLISKHIPSPLPCPRLVLDLIPAAQGCSFVISWISWSSYNSSALLLYIISLCNTETSEKERFPWLVCKMSICPL